MTIGVVCVEQEMKETLLDVYSEIDRDDVRQRQLFWDVLSCFGAASDFMKCLQEEKEDTP